MDSRGLIVSEVAMIGLRVKEEKEKAGLGLAIHNERAYKLTGNDGCCLAVIVIG